MTSVERRITVLASIYPQLKEWADRDGLTVADVANAILLQNIRPYGAGCAGLYGSPAVLSGMPTELPSHPGQPLAPDPYQTAVVDSW
ncbi:MAG: hypothetical protein AAF329_01165 [Cyanobacteria bacterium P01_A01_bin.17]